MRYEHMKTEVGAEDVGKQGEREKERRERGRCARIPRSGSTGPHLDAWDRHPRFPGIVPTLIAYTQHLHIYNRLLRWGRQSVGVIREALATRAGLDQPLAFESRSFPTFCEITRKRYSLASDLADRRYDLGPDREIAIEDRSHLRELHRYGVL